jgi:hypothetical protein
VFIQEFFDPAEQARGYYSFELFPGHRFKATSFTIGQWKKEFIASKAFKNGLVYVLCRSS